MKYIYLDVDGCINHDSTGEPRKNTGWTGEWFSQWIAGEKVKWSAELVEALNELDKRSDITFVWATDWRLEAPMYLCPAIGLHGEDWEVLLPTEDEIKSGSYRYFWKSDYIAAHIEKHRPEKALWIDDNGHSFFMADEWARELPTEFLFVVPNHYHGISKKHFKVIEEFFSD